MLIEKISFGARTVRLSDMRKNSNERLEGSLGEQMRADDVWHYECKLVDFTPATIDLPASIRQIMQRGIFSGFYQDTFYTLMLDYGLIGISQLGTCSTILLLKDQLPDTRSVYLIRSIIRQHVHRHMFFDNLVPLHASAVVLPEQDTAIMIVGKSGSGKSSMTWQFVQCDCSLLADDNVLCSPGGFISGSGGMVVVRPGFISMWCEHLRPQALEVSPGRKYALPVANKEADGIIPRMILLPRIDPLAASRIEWTAWESATEDIMEAHQGWVYSKNELTQLTGAFQALRTHVSSIGYVHLGKSPEVITKEVLRFYAHQEHISRI